MIKKIKKFILISILLGIGYFLANYHIIIYGTDFTFLKKTEVTFRYTFFMIDHKRPDKILRIGPLRDAGIGDLLVELDRIRQWKKDELEAKYDYEEEYE